MTLWIRRGTVGKDEIENEIREQPFSPGRKWAYISSAEKEQMEAIETIRKAKAQYAPSGGFGKGVEAGLERGRVKAVSGGMQNLVSAGLAGTTMAAGLGTKFEEEIAAPARARVEEQRAQAISGIEMQEAGMGFQASQAGLQRNFQASQSFAQRDLQRYITDLQATLQREEMALRGPAISPTGGGYARQFPATYDAGDVRVPDWTGGGGISPMTNIPQSKPAEIFWGASEKWRSEQDLLGTKFGTWS